MFALLYTHTHTHTHIEGEHGGEGYVDCYAGGLSELLQMCYTLPNRGSLSYFMKFAY